MGTTFKNVQQAEAYFHNLRDNNLQQLKEIEAAHPYLKLDNTADSLQRLEDFFFDGYVHNKLPIPVSREQMELLITQYIRQTFVANGIAQWIVFENKFSPGQFDLGLDYGNGEGTNQLFGKGLDKKEDCEKGKYLFETYQLYV